MTQSTIPICPSSARRKADTDDKIEFKAIIKKSLRAINFPEVSSNTLVRLSIVVGLAVLCLAVWVNWDNLEETARLLKASTMGKILFIVAQAFLYIKLAVFFWRLWLFRRYRPAPTCTDRQLPTCTIIVPAYNEGRQVLATLESLIASDYPPEKMQILAVDDGSKDDTWQWMLAAGEKFPGRIQLVKMEKNQGKRHALREGFLRATGETLVTVDSDSIVRRMTLRRLVSPFVQDPKIGAVAGNVRVLNRNEGFIPRMLDVSFLFSFDFMRASQSEVRTVFCTPGALAGYRRDVVDKVLEEWTHQKFMGQVANHGEDRHLTNLIIREGYDVTFQQNSLVYTNVPTGYKGLCKMFLRWARSDARETLHMSAFLFRKFSWDRLGAQINLVMAWMTLTVSQLFLLAALACLVWHPILFGLNMLVGAAISACLPAALYAIRRRSADGIYAYGYAVFWLLGLAWITPYAMSTCNRGGWLTRELTTTPPASSQSA